MRRWLLMQNNNEDFIVISNNILKRRLTLLIGLIFISIVHTIFFFISYVIRGNEMLYTVLDGLLCLSLWGYLIFYIVKGKYAMFESLYRAGRLIYSLPIVFYAIITIVHGAKYSALNYEYLVYMILAIALELFIFRFNLKDPNPLKKNNKSLVLSIIAMALVPLFLGIGYFTGAEISVLDFSRTIKYELNEEGTLTASGVYNGLSKSARVKATFYTQSVTSIVSDAFNNIDDLYIEGNPYLEKGSLNGVRRVHVLYDENVLKGNPNTFDGEYIEVPRGLVDSYRNDSKFKRYEIYPAINNNEVFVNFKDVDLGYISTLILKKGDILPIEALTKSKDQTKYLYKKTNEYEATDDYYFNIYNDDKVVIPYWFNENGVKVAFNEKLEESMTITPKIENVMHVSIDYKVDPSLNEEVYISDSRSYPLKKLEDFNRVGFDNLTYSSKGEEISEVTSKLGDNAKVDASWSLEAPLIENILGLEDNMVSRVYDPDETTKLEPELSHSLPVEYSYYWRKNQYTVSSAKNFDIHNVNQSGEYILYVEAKYSEYGVEYTSTKAEAKFSVAIEKAIPVLTASSIDTVYDGNPHTITDAKITYGEDTTIRYQYKTNGSDSMSVPIGADEYEATISINETANFTALSITVPITISKREVAITLYDNMGHTYNGIGSNALDTRYTSSSLKSIEEASGDRGLIAGDTLNPSLYGLTSFDERYYAGEYLIDCVIDNPNYQISYTPVTYKVLKREATIKEVSDIFIYGDEVSLTEPTITNVSDDDLSLIQIDMYQDDTLTTLAQKSLVNGFYDAGTYYVGYYNNSIITANYDITHYIGAIEVLKREITVTPSLDTLTYNGEAQSYNVELYCPLDEFMAFNVANVVDNVRVDAGTYQFSVEIEDSYKKNYQLSSFNDTFTIEKRSIELYYTPITKTYGEDLVLNYQVVDHGDDQTLLDKDKIYLNLGLYIKDTTTSVTKDYYGYYPANTYEIYHIPNESLDKNYAITDSKAIVSIAKRELTFSLKNSELTYNGLEQINSYTIYNEAKGQKDLVLNVSGNKNKNVGNYIVNVEIKDAFKDNYSISENSYSYSIVKKDLAVIVNDEEISYGDEYIPSVMMVGFVQDEDSTLLEGTLSYSTTYDQYDPVGEYEVEASGLTSNNYNIIYTKGTLYVLPKEVEGTITCSDITYGESFAPLVSFTGFVNSIDEAEVAYDFIILNLNDEEVSGLLNAGEYKVECYATHENYSITVEGVSVAVEKKALNITLSDETINKGEALNLGSLLSISGLIGSDTIDGSVSILDYGNDTTILDSGTYTIIFTANESTNYVIDTTITAVLTVL